jgi:small subunit ribosomal protein S8
MAVHDIIGDCLNSIKMASASGLASCRIPYSRLALHIAGVLKSEGFILAYQKIEISSGVAEIEVTLKYVSGIPSITGIMRHSKPGCRRYYAASTIPRVLSGIGVAILTTSKGVMSDKKARHENVGGELIAKIW